MTDHEQTLKPGSQLEEFRIERILGEGGFGITYLAFDQHFQKHVAIKEYFYAPWCFRSEGNSVKSRSNHKEDFRYGLDSFLQEARTIAKFEHPNIVKVIRFFEANGTAYIVMEYIEGQTLGSQIDEFKNESGQGMFNEKEMLFVLQPIISGLKQLHRANVYHRDLKPDNIMLREKGSPVLIDFGASKEAIGIKSQTIDAIVAAGYSPIEQYSTKIKLGAWTDIYALAAVAYTCLTGEKPDESTHRVIDDEVIPLVEAARDQGSLNFLKAVDNALAMRPADRPQTLEKWWEQLTGGREKGIRGDDVYLKERIKKREAKQGCRRLITCNGKTIRLLVPANFKSGTQIKFKGMGRPGENGGENGDLYIEVIVEKPDLKLILGGSLILLMIIGLGISQKDNLEQWVTDYRYKQEEARQQKQAEKQKAIESLLASAEANIKQLHLSSPNGNNAVEKYQQVLQLEAGNVQAQQGLKVIIDKYLKMAALSQQRNDYVKATRQLQQATTINAGDPQLAKAEQGLKTAQQAYEAEQESQARKKAEQAAAEKKRANSPRIAMVRITPGCFLMGSENGESDEKPVHRVCITKSYELGKYEVTQAQWKKVMGDSDNPSFLKGNNKPVDGVGWVEVQDFIRKLNRLSGQNYRLPTEAEWEYACRSGGKQQSYCGGNDIGSVAWYYENADYKIQNVGKKKANGLGVYDMTGNAWEWVSDWYGRDYYSRSPVYDPKGPSNGSIHVFRGGSLSSYVGGVGSTIRHSSLGGGMGGASFIGFRLAR